MLVNMPYITRLTVNLRETKIKLQLVELSIYCLKLDEFFSIMKEKGSFYNF
jgi:hypothetical protein